MPLNDISDNFFDVHSFAEPQKTVVKHLNLNLRVDFDNCLLIGVATYQFERTAEAAEIIFDTQSLYIKKVLINNLTETNFKLGAAVPFLGQPLQVALPADARTVTIFYQTTPQSAALQWLNPTQTAGKKEPFLFTQSQAILARTWLPCQDSPGIRFTYEATVQVPPRFMALMSAGNPQQKNEQGTYYFSMKQLVPSYLLALAVGDLKFKSLSDRTGIYAEPIMLETAFQEFASLPEMLQTAEVIYGKYQWNRYDLLLLPPSFPFGGMENPRLTFVTPTIITGDQSLISLIAHELAHSWSGNLVTNATWNDFWLNEGFTVYFERRIMEALFGKDYADMLKVLGYQDLQHTLDEMGRQSADTHLKLNLANRDPDEGLTEIAYEKGNLFLLKLEEVVGRDLFDAFVRQYFRDFAFQSMTTEKFLHYLQENLLNQNANFALQVKPEEWIYQAGIPAGAPVIKSARFEQVKTQATNWNHNLTIQNLLTANWSTHEWLYFLNLIADKLTTKGMQQLDQAFNFSQSLNAEILVVWFEQAIRLNYKAADQAIAEFLLRVGRRKFLVPLYKALMNQDKTKAQAIYRQARPNYHAVATSTLDAIVQL